MANQPPPAQVQVPMQAPPNPNNKNIPTTTTSVTIVNHPPTSSAASQNFSVSTPLTSYSTTPSSVKSQSYPPSQYYSSSSSTSAHSDSDPPRKLVSSNMISQRFTPSTTLTLGKLTIGVSGEETTVDVLIRFIRRLNSTKRGIQLFRDMQI